MPKNITIETQEQSDSKSQLQNPSANVSAKTFDSASISAIIPDTYVNMEDFCNKFLSKLANQLQLVQAVMYVKNARDEFNFCGSYAFYSTIKPLPFKAGEGINGQVARNKKPLQIKNIPNNYATIISGLGEGNPQNVIIIPIIKDNTTIGLLEIASFINLNYDFNDISEKLSDTIGEILFNLLGK
jgi:putative methionine-R-sulfoxide reductase with GAF domain